MDASAPPLASTLFDLPRSGAAFKQIYEQHKALHQSQEDHISTEADSSHSQPLSETIPPELLPLFRLNPAAESLKELCQEIFKEDRAKVNNQDSQSTEKPSQHTAQPHQAAEAPADQGKPEPSSSSKAKQSASEPVQPETEQQRSQRRTTKANVLMTGFVDRQMQLMLAPLVGDYANEQIFAEIHSQYSSLAGYPKHPAVVMLVQQVVLFHFLIPVMYRRAFEAPTVEAAGMYFNQASRMNDILRKGIAQIHELGRSLNQSANTATRKPRAKKVVNTPTSPPPSATSAA